MSFHFPFYENEKTERRLIFLFLQFMNMKRSKVDLELQILIFIHWKTSQFGFRFLSDRCLNCNCWDWGSVDLISGDRNYRLKFVMIIRSNLFTFFITSKERVANSCLKIIKKTFDLVKNDSFDLLIVLSIK